MPNYFKNDVILVRYPFSNLSNFKVDRKAIALSKTFKPSAISQSFLEIKNSIRTIS